MAEWLSSWLPVWLAAPGRCHQFYAHALWVIPVLPFVGFLINGLGYRVVSRPVSGAVACLASAAAFFWSWLCFQGLTGTVETAPLHATYATWIQVGSFSCPFGLYMDPLAGVMCLFVTGVGTLIHLYSLGYMAHDEGHARYFAFLNLFLFAMLTLVLADNLLLCFVGWEGVGLCSYLLIGFWYEDREKAAAGMKAFIFNRIGDLGFLLGLFLLAVIFGTVNYAAPTVYGPGSPTRYGLAQPVAQPLAWIAHVPGGADSVKPVVALPEQPGLLNYAAGLEKLDELNRKPENILPGHPLGAAARFELSPLARNVPLNLSLGAGITLACLLLFLGACGKSAQLPLYAWLPDAMAGPTPVSALIHAATMVTAGVYLVARLHGLFVFSGEALTVVAFVGALTAIFAALIGLTQTDIKKVLAYSTISQLGYMFLAAGVGTFSLAMFHVVTHAFFKALLFLCAGSVIHALAGEQDMRRMGGLRTRLPVTFWTMLAGAAALSGIPFTSGWYSKDEILMSVLARAEAGHQALFYGLYVLGIVAAFCTAFYTFRLIGLTFFGPPRMSAETQAQVHESPPIMTLPLFVLAIFALIGGLIWHASLPPFLDLADVEHGSPELRGHAHHLNLALTTVAALGGLALAWLFYIRQARVPQPQDSRNPLVRLSFNQFYVDAFYMKVVAPAFEVFSEVLFLLVDVLIIDFLLVTGVAACTKACGRGLRRLQSGLTNAYAAGILCGALAVLFWLLLRQ